MSRSRRVHGGAVGAEGGVPSPEVRLERWGKHSSFRRLSSGVWEVGTFGITLTALGVNWRSHKGWHLVYFSIYGKKKKKDLSAPSFNGLMEMLNNLTILFNVHTHFIIVYYCCSHFAERRQSWSTGRTSNKRNTEPWWHRDAHVALPPTHTPTLPSILPQQFQGRTSLPHAHLYPGSASQPTPSHRKKDCHGLVVTSHNA